jgi:hypothetical protein
MSTELLRGHVTNEGDHPDLRGEMFPVDRETGPTDVISHDYDPPLRRYSHDHDPGGVTVFSRA